MADKIVNTNLLLQNAARVRDALDGVLPQDYATMAQLGAAIEGLAWKDSCRVATQGNVNLAAPGATVDGITMTVGDRTLVRAQSAPAENGIYVWNGAAVAMTRAADANTFPELEQATVTTEEGTSAGVTFRQTAINGTIGATAVNWAVFGTSSPAASETVAGIAELATQAEVDTGTDTTRIVTPAGLAAWPNRAKRYAADFGDGVATSFTITHGLNTRDLDVTVRLTSGSLAAVEAEVQYTSVSAVTIIVNTPPASNAYRAMLTA